jgi:hypothetical protein
MGSRKKPKAEVVRPVNEFATALAFNGMDRQTANGVAMAWKNGGPEVQQRLIEKLSLSHGMRALAIYADDLYGYGDTYTRKWVR